MNIHQYPENKDDLPKYRIAVMQAALEGKPVQWRDAGCLTWLDPFDDGDMSWDWYGIEYRIKPELAYKPWTSETFRWPDCLRRRGCGAGPGLPFAVLEVREDHVRTTYTGFEWGGYCFSWQGLLDHCEASYDRGQTWVRCGEEVK